MVVKIRKLTYFNCRAHQQNNTSEEPQVMKGTYICVDCLMRKPAASGASGGREIC